MKKIILLAKQLYAIILRIFGNIIYCVRFLFRSIPIVLKFMVNVLNKFFRNMFRIFKLVFCSKFTRNVIYKPLQYVFVSFIFLVSFLFILDKAVPRLNLYVSIQDSIVEMGKAVHIVVKKQNQLALYIGHSDSSEGWQEDNYKITWVEKDAFSKVYFGIENPSEDDLYKKIRLFIQFTDNKRKVDGKDGGSGRWVKFKDNHFNYGFIQEISQTMGVQTSSLLLKFPSEGIYPFKYTLYADGYRPRSGIKNMIVGR